MPRVESNEETVEENLEKNKLEKSVLSSILFWLICQCNSRFQFLTLDNGCPMKQRAKRPLPR